MWGVLDLAKGFSACQKVQAIWSCKLFPRMDWFLYGIVDFSNCYCHHHYGINHYHKTSCCCTAEHSLCVSYKFSNFFFRKTHSCVHTSGTDHVLWGSSWGVSSGASSREPQGDSLHQAGRAQRGVSQGWQGIGVRH